MRHELCADIPIAGPAFKSRIHLARDASCRVFLCRARSVARVQTMLPIRRALHAAGVGEQVGAGCRPVQRALTSPGREGLDRVRVGESIEPREEAIR